MVETSMRIPDNGDYIIVDGLDGIGKGVVERTLIEAQQRKGRAVFDTISFSRANAKGLPELSDFWNPPTTQYHTIVVAEPTYSGVGHVIRNELVFRNGRDYPPETLIEAYSVDRAVQMKRVVLPALAHGLSVIQGRCFASTIAYQGNAMGLKPEDIPRFAKELGNHEGNRLQMENSPGLLIIPKINDFDELIKRLKERAARTKDDNSIFDNLEFQRQIAPFYYSDEMRDLFQSMGTKVEYVDVGGTLEDTVRGTLEIYKKYNSISLPSPHAKTI